MAFVLEINTLVTVYGMNCTPWNSHFCPWKLEKTLGFLEILNLKNPAFLGAKSVRFREFFSRQFDGSAAVGGWGSCRLSADGGGCDSWKKITFGREIHSLKCIKMKLLKELVDKFHMLILHVKIFRNGRNLCGSLYNPQNSLVHLDYQQTLYSKYVEKAWCFDIFIFHHR